MTDAKDKRATIRRRIEAARLVVVIVLFLALITLAVATYTAVMVPEAAFG